MIIGIVAGCSGDSTAPNSHGSVEVQFVSGDGQSDTIQSVLARPLVIRVSTPAGQPAAHAAVQFVGVPGLSGSQVYAELPVSPFPHTFGIDSTDASGELSVVIEFGYGAGPGHLVVQVPRYGYSDTAVFTISPGNAAGVSVSPADTAVFADSSVTLGVWAIDRAGNHRPEDPVTLSVLSGPATMSGTRVTATGVGLISVLAKAAKGIDTAQVVAVPAGSLATAAFGGGVAVFNLDGSNYHLITTAPAGTVKWAPSGNQVVFDETLGGGEYGGDGGIDAVDLSGRIVTVDSTVPDAAVWPQVSRDGVWVYYSRMLPGSAGGILWRAHRDGSGAGDSLSSQMPSFDIFPSPSPDGSQIAYVADLSDPMPLRVLTLATGAVTSLGVNAWSPSWSPTSDMIAYVAGGGAGQIALIHSNGTGGHVLSAGVYYGNIDWSPDGQWIVGLNYNTQLIDIVNATSGLTLTLPYTGSEWSPAWKPK